MKSLSVVERAKQAITINHTEDELLSLSKEYTDVGEIKDENDYSLVKSACKKFQVVRLDITKAGKSARDDANKFAKAVIAEEKRLLAIISPEEVRLKNLKTEYDTREQRIAAERLRKEEERKAAILDKINTITAYKDSLFGKSAKELEAIQLKVSATQITEDSYQEYTDDAKQAKSDLLNHLATAIKERKEIDDLRKKQAEEEVRQAEETRKLEEERRQLIAEQEKLAAEAAALERAKREEENKRIAAEREEADRIRQEKERLEREKREAEQAEARRLAEEEERKRQELLRPEKDRLIDWLKSLRFIDGIQIKNEALSGIQRQALDDLSDLSFRYIKKVENI